jgi:hypothetical protein
MEFNDLETIRIDKLSLADNPTVQMNSETSADSIITRESPKIVPVALHSVEPPAAKNGKPLWIAAVFVLGVLAIGGIAGAMWLNSSTGTNSNSGPAGAGSPTTTPAPALVDIPAAVETPLPGVVPASPAPTPAPKNPVITREKPRPENAPIRPAPTPPKVRKTPKPQKDPYEIFKP